MVESKCKPSEHHPHILKHHTSESCDCEVVSLFTLLDQAQAEQLKLEKSLAESQAKCDHADELLTQSLRIEEKVRKELEESQAEIATLRRSNKEAFDRFYVYGFESIKLNAACATYMQALEKVNSNEYCNSVCKNLVKESLKSNAGKEWIEAVREAKNALKVYSDFEADQKPTWFIAREALQKLRSLLGEKG